MSKSTELRILRGARSIDAPLSHQSRTGESDNVGSMLDVYVQVESVEETLLRADDERAKALFLKGFQMYLKKVFTKQERQFLARLLTGKETPYNIGQALGVEDYFAFLQAIHVKAYDNVNPLARLATLTGWSGAQPLIKTILERLAQLKAGASIAELIPQLSALEKQRAQKRARNRSWYSKNGLEYHKKWRENNREKRRETNRRYRAKKKYYSVKETLRREYLYKLFLYRKKNRERINACNRQYYDRHRDEICARRRKKAPLMTEEQLAAKRARDKAYYERRKAEILAKRAKIREENREQVREYQREYHRQHREQCQEYQRQYRARKKAV